MCVLWFMRMCESCRIHTCSINFNNRPLGSDSVCHGSLSPAESACHDSFIRVPWLTHTCDMTPLCMTWLIRVCAMTHSYVVSRVPVSHGICVPWVLQERSFWQVTYIWFVSHTYIVCDSCICVLEFISVRPRWPRAMARREVGGWGRDPKKCTGRDWGMGSSTI